MSLAEARRIAQPPGVSPSPTDPPYRFFSIFLSVPLACWGVTANQVTIASAVIGLAGAASFMLGTYRAGLLGAVLLQLAYLLDYVDGEIARLRQSSSRRGYFLDLVTHAVIKTAIFLGASYGVFAAGRGPRILIWGFAASVASAATQALPSIAVVAGLTDRAPGPRRRRTLATRIEAVICYLFESPGLFGLLLAGAVFDRIAVIVVAYGVAAPLYFLYRAWEYRFPATASRPEE